MTGIFAPRFTSNTLRQTDVLGGVITFFMVGWDKLASSAGPPS